MRVTVRGYAKDGTSSFGNIYRVTKAEINTRISDDLMSVQIPDEAWVRDFSLDPDGEKSIDYDADSTRSLLQWQEILGKTNESPR